MKDVVVGLVGAVVKPEDRLVHGDEVTDPMEELDDAVGPLGFPAQPVEVDRQDDA
jgi:hypothetical protein